MGLMGDWLRGKRMKDPVRGTAQVVACSRMTQAAAASNCVMNLVVSGEGVHEWVHDARHLLGFPCH